MINKIKRQKREIRNIVKYLFKYLTHYRFLIVKIKNVDNNIKNVNDNIKNVDNNIKNINDNIKNTNDNIKNIKIKMKKIINEIIIYKFLSKKIIVEKKKKKIIIKKISPNSFKNVENNIKNITN